MSQMQRAHRFLRRRQSTKGEERKRDREEAGKEREREREGEGENLFFVFLKKKWMPPLCCFRP